MTDLPSETVKPLANRRWLIASRLLAAMPMVAVLCITVWVHLPVSGGVCSADVSFVTDLVFWLATLPYVLSVAHLLGKSANGLKKGLAWAVVAGSFWAGIGLLFGLPEAFRGSAREAWPFLLLSLVQIALAACAIKTYYSTVRQKGDLRILLRCVGWFVPYLILMFMVTAALPDLYYSSRHSREAEAVRALRKINSAEESYSRTYPLGFSPSLAALRPPSNGAAPSAAAAGLIEGDLAAGTKSEYAFRYTHDAPDPTGKITSYTATATPAHAACTQWKRFFIDQTGAIHVTTENRSATVGDPAL